MSNLIKLLPDAVANQIAAGEVVQRPASAVKELLENSIDSGATHVQLIIKDAGKTLIQVIDDGCGMGETDARMCFERHATSKIKETNDLFSIRTKGFRGEAMASIAAVAQVEMKTKLHDQEVGVKIDIEGSKILTQEPVQTPNGTSIAIKNLFFNIPARRNFLKSNQVETRHIIDEFQRVALTHPEVSFKMTHNGSEIFNLPQGTLRQRIVNVFGKKFNQSLVPIDEKTSITNLTGFIGKPEFAKKTRGEQFFFVNKRYIKNSYLNYAVMQAYQDLIPTKSFPSYFIYMDMDPASIDINIHPTKTEIKFETESNNVYLGDFDVSYPGEYEKSGILLEVKEYNEKLFYHFLVEGKHLVIVNTDTVDLKEEILSFFGDVDVLLIHGSKETAKLFENIEAKLAIPFVLSPSIKSVASYLKYEANISPAVIRLKKANSGFSSTIRSACI